MAEDVEVLGIPQLQADLAKWVMSIPDAVDQRTNAIADAMVQQLAASVPYVEGTLAGSAQAIPASELSDPQGGGFALALGQTDAQEYAGWIEFGGNRGRDLVPEGRYIYPTVVDYTSQFLAAVSEGVTDSINSYPWSQPG
jgi:hypothetical protein